MRVSPIYTNTVQEMRLGTRRVIHQGGMGSGKTVNILGALATLATEEEGEAVTTVTSMSFPHLKGGALRDFEMYVYPTFKNAIVQYHKTDHIFTFRSGHMIEFKVFETEMDARGPRRKRLFCNEVNRMEYMKFYQLDARSNQTIVDYNPSARFWVHDKLIPDTETNKLFISDHRHNPFLTASKHAEIENNPDKELWRVYARGLTGNVLGVIFPDWEMIDLDDFPKDVDYSFSIDFGYTVDPTVIIKQCKIGNSLFVDELVYEPGISTNEIRTILVGNGFNLKNDILYCDHDPEQIRMLRNGGIEQAIGARKGAGSIKAGIDYLKTLRVKYSNRSQNLHRERSQYIWQTDKATGKTLNVPVEYSNHTFDAVRYGAFTQALRA